MKIHFILPIKVVSELNKAGHEHWMKTANRRKQQRFAAKLMTAGQVKDKWDGQPITVTFTRLIGKGGRKFDSGDNLSSSFKAIRDGVADGLEINDNDPRVTWEYEQVKDATHMYGVKITFTDTPFSTEAKMFPTLEEFGNLSEAKGEKDGKE
ncbi:MAG: hypothetical protein LUG23_05835 [Oscillospiraceae bacterium]|nr:hypothetical protein [Oscillospiraceae bacterium]